jgi:hypothetical protein
MTHDALSSRLTEILERSPRVWEVLTTARDLDFPDWLLVSGAVYQTVWNSLTDRHPDYGIKDYDLLYFDRSDLSYEAEDVYIKSAAARFPTPLNTLVEVRNQARVHLWFEAHFQEPYAPLNCSDEALSRFVCPAFAVGVRLTGQNQLEIVAPLGLQDIFDMVLRPNPLRALATGWAKTTRSARNRWPEARIIEP